MFPENTDADVSAMLDHLEIAKEDRQKQFVFQSNVAEAKGVKHPFPTPCTVFDAVKRFVDLSGSVSKKTLKSFSGYCLDPKEKQRMIEIATSKDLLASEISSKQIGLLHVLSKMFPSCKPQLTAFLQNSQRIMPRYYTIASSNKAWPDQIRIAISLTINQVGHKTVLGFCS